MDSPMPRILLIDDSALILELMRQALGGEHDFEVFTAAGGEEALALLATLTPDVVVCDLEMPKVSGIEVVSRIKVAFPDLPVLILTEHSEVALVVEAMRQGAYGFLQKSTP